MDGVARGDGQHQGAYVTDLNLSTWREDVECCFLDSLRRLVRRSISGRVRKQCESHHDSRCRPTGDRVAERKGYVDEATLSP